MFVLICTPLCDRARSISADRREYPIESETPDWDLTTDGSLVRDDEDCWRCSGPAGEDRSRDSSTHVGGDDVCREQQSDGGDINETIATVLEEETDRALGCIVSARPDCVTEQESNGKQQEHRNEAHDLRLIRTDGWTAHESTLSVQGELVKVHPRSPVPFVDGERRAD